MRRSRARSPMLGAQRRRCGRACALRLALTAAATLWAAALPAALPAAALPAVAPGSLDELLALLAHRQHGEADFQELKYVAVLEQPIKSSGVLIYDAPDHLEQRIVRPRPETVVLDHGVLTMHIGKRERSVRLADYPQLAPLVESIRALLAGDRATLEELFTLHFGGTLDHWQLRLEPRDARRGSALREIDIRGEGDAIREVQLHQSNGDHSVMLIQPRE